MARTVDDVLARRTRSLILDARAAAEAAARAAELLARELGREPLWARAQAESFRLMAGGYVLA
jgi:glycerol-3-phosphate dehydrogenase